MIIQNVGREKGETDVTFTLPRADLARASQILENAKERALIFDLVGEPVRVVCAFPREVRYFYEKNRTRSDKDKLKFEDVEHDAYDIMAKLCLDAPFNTPAFWEYFDTHTGMFWGTFNAIYQGIEKNEEKIGDFRKK